MNELNQNENNIISESENINEYNIVSLTIDELGEYLFIGLKNGKIEIYSMENLDDEDKGKREEIIFSKNTKVNTILFENKHFHFIFIACEKGLYIQKIKGKSYCIDDSEECISLCFDMSKDYLFAGFKSGIIKVFNIKEKKIREKEKFEESEEEEHSI